VSAADECDYGNVDEADGDESTSDKEGEEIGAAGGDLEGWREGRGIGGEGARGRLGRRTKCRLRRTILTAAP